MSIKVPKLGNFLKVKTLEDIDSLEATEEMENPGFTVLPPCVTETLLNSITPCPNHLLLIIIKSIQDLDDTYAKVDIKQNSYPALLFIWVMIHTMPAAYYERSDSQITTGESEIQWAEKLHNRLPLDNSPQDSGPNDSPKRPDSEITGIAEALNKFSSQLEENNEVIAKKAKNSDEDKIQKHYNELDPAVKLLILNVGSKNGTAGQPM